MGFGKLFLVFVFVKCVYGQEQTGCYGAGSVAGAAIGAFIGALLLVAAAYYLRKLYWKSRKGKHLVFSTDPESVKDEFAFDNPGFRQDERAWQHAPTLPLKGSSLHAEFTKPEQSKDDDHIQRARVRRVKLWARDFTGLGLRCSGGAREGVRVHSVLRSGPAAAAKLEPGDKIKSIKIEFSGTPLEDALAILSLASPYPVELEVVEGGRTSGAGRGVRHPLLKRAGSTGDVSTLEKEGKLLHPPQSPNASHSNNSTLETKHKGIKKIITEKIVPTTLERNKKEKKELPTTLERENEKNIKLNKNRHSDVVQTTAASKPERNKVRHSTGDVIIQAENGTANLEHAEVQKREYDPKRGMKFGIRVLPPNVPDDGVLKQKNVENGVVAVQKVETKTVDEPDKPEPQRPAPVSQVKLETETEVKKPVVAKRREKMAPPIPNARTKPEDLNTSTDSRTSEIPPSTFARTDLNSSGIKRDENGIPQELPQHMFDAARAARSNRKSSTELLYEKDTSDKIEQKKDEAPKPNKKSKGKAPSPPELEKNKTDDSMIEQMKNVNDFLKSEKQFSSILHDSITSANTTTTTCNTSTPYASTPKAIKTKPAPQPNMEESINFSQDDIDDIVHRPFKRESDSLNNYFEDSKSNLSSNQDVHSVVSLNHSDKSDKGSTTIELNNSDVTIHSSPLDDTLNSASDDTSILDENERKAASLGDLSRFELRVKTNMPSTGTLERAQSLDISAEDGEINETLSPKKRKAMSVVESTFYDTAEDTLPEMDPEKGVTTKHKEPRLSLNIAKTSAMEGLNTFQRNRLKKASEFGNLEDAIVKGSTSSVESEKVEQESQNQGKELDSPPLVESETHETSDHLARRIIDENMKVHLKLVSEFAKSTSDGSNMSSLDSMHDISPKKESPIKFDEKHMSYDTNIPDDLKVSRNTYVNSLERPKSDMMKKLLAKNPILNVHIDQGQKSDVATSKETPTPMTDASKSAISQHQPDIVNFNLKTTDPKLRDYDEFVSNIRVGSNNSMKFDKKPPMETFSSEWSEPKQSSNVVTITTAKTQSAEDQRKSYTKHIEIGEPNVRLIPDIVEGIKRKSEEKDGRTLYMEPANVSLTMTQEPVQKTVTVNVTEDELGNKVIRQNVEKVSTQYITAKGDAPLHVEQVTFGISKSSDLNEINLEEGDVADIDKKILDEIKRQNPNMHFTSDEPAYTRTETIILNTELDEQQAKALMDKITNDPSFMAQKTPEELSKLGIRIIRDLDDVQDKTDDTVEVTKTRYTINPSAMSDSQKQRLECTQDEPKKEHITEIQVVTPRTEKQQKEKDKILSRQRVPPSESEPPLSYELDPELLNDFISNERHYSAKQQEKRTKTNTNQNEPKKRHSDFDLPRNSTIKFTTSTYQSPKGTIVTSTDLENRRLSQLDQMQLRSGDQSAAKPVISAKPSSIPVVKAEKPKPVTVSSKIPVFMSQKSLSQENLAEKTFSVPSSPPPKLVSSGSSGNISVTSIKSSSRSPSGGKYL